MGSFPPLRRGSGDRRMGATPYGSGGPAAAAGPIAGRTPRRRRGRHHLPCVLLACRPSKRGERPWRVAAAPPAVAVLRVSAQGRCQPTRGTNPRLDKWDRAGKSGTGNGGMGV